MSHWDESEFDKRLSSVMPDDMEDMSDDDLMAYMGLFLNAHDRLLNVAEERGLVRWNGGCPIIYYDIPDSRHVDTVLTRERSGDPSGSEHTH